MHFCFRENKLFLTIINQYFERNQHNFYTVIHYFSDYEMVGARAQLQPILNIHLYEEKLCNRNRLGNN